MASKKKKTPESHLGFTKRPNGLWKNKQGVELTSKREIAAYKRAHDAEKRTAAYLKKDTAKIRALSKDLWKYKPDEQARRRAKLAKATGLFNISKESAEKVQREKESILNASMERKPRMMLKKMHGIEVYYFNHADFDVFMDTMGELSKETPYKGVQFGIYGHNAGDDTDRYQGQGGLFIGAVSTSFKDYYKAMETVIDHMPPMFRIEYYWMRTKKAE